MGTYTTEQENVWANDFGNKYIERNEDEWRLTSAIVFFSKIMAKTSSIASVLEFGANIGLNLQAIHAILPKVSLSAVEINSNAVDKLKNTEYINVFHNSALEYEVEKEYDFVLTKTFLIHINPEKMPLMYDKIYNSSKKYICIAEYYNPSPVTIEYRGNSNILFKRDFAGELLDKYNDLKLIDYGFAYHKDNNFFQDDITWFLLEKIK